MKNSFNEFIQNNASLAIAETIRITSKDNFSKS